MSPSTSQNAAPAPINPTRAFTYTNGRTDEVVAVLLDSTKGPYSYVCAPCAIHDGVCEFTDIDDGGDDGEVSFITQDAWDTRYGADTIAAEAAQGPDTCAECGVTIYTTPSS